MKQRTSVRASDSGTRDLLKQAVQRGWSVTGGGNRHFRISCPSPCRCTYTLSASGSDRSALTRTLVRLTRYTCWKESTSP